MSDSVTDEHVLPSAQECESRCQEFADITGTDSALAMFYLQDRDWDLYRALNSYFEEKNSSSTKDVLAGGSGNASAIVLSDDDDGDSHVRRTSEPYRIRLLSWNIDGLDPKNVRSRNIGICNTIKAEDPHVVFLQEVVQESEGILQDMCPTYHMIPGNVDGYFTAMLIKIGVVEVEESTILSFPQTVMMRNLLAVKCKIKGEKFLLMTSHLESTKEHASTRKEQLKKCFRYMVKADGDRTVVFGGDMNLRDKELDEIGGIPESIYDIWEITGKRPEAKFTWDQERNDNLEMSAKFKPKCRFDRFFIRHSQSKGIQPEYLELVGLQRLKSCQRFCSDHWGVLVHFNILSKLPK